MVAVGWWSKDMFGGDAPLDILDGFSRVFTITDHDGLLSTPDRWSDQTRAAVRAVFETHGSLTGVLAQLDFEHAGPTGVQAIGALLIGAGAPLSDEDQARLIAALEADEWAQTDEDRAAVIDAYITQVWKYDATPVSGHHVSLFEQLAAHTS